MKLTDDELGYLSAWAREEWEPACYRLPAHRLQLDHGVTGADLIVLIKAWADAESKKDQDILDIAVDPHPRWPWPTKTDFGNRLIQANHFRSVAKA